MQQDMLIDLIFRPKIAVVTSTETHKFISDWLRASRFKASFYDRPVRCLNLKVLRRI